jgi:hypothetical protein
VKLVIDRDELDRSLRADLRAARAQVLMIAIGGAAIALGVTNAGVITAGFAMAFAANRYLAVRNLVRLAQRDLN